MKPAHYRGTYLVRSERLRNAANADPATRCWRCGRTKAEHGRAWTAGHVVAGDSSPTADLRPECAECNYRHGASMTNGRAKPNASRNW